VLGRCPGQETIGKYVAQNPYRDFIYTFAETFEKFCKEFYLMKANN